MRDADDLMADRGDAGRRLALKLAAYSGRKDAMVLGLPRGGVVVAFEVAKALDVPLDVLLVRKLGVPGHEELAMGAIAGGDVRVMNADVLRDIHITERQMEAVVNREQALLEHRERLYRGRSEPLDPTGKVVILVDDGLATGASMRTAVQLVQKSMPARVVVAVPVAPRETCADLQREVDEVVCVMTPESFYGVGAWYLDFVQTSDEEVIRLLDEARTFGKDAAPPGSGRTGP